MLSGLPKSLSPDEDFFSVPIFIQNYNHVSYLTKQLQWLVSAGYQNLIVLDNNSSYVPLLRFYDELSSIPQITVVRGSHNSKFALWEFGYLERFRVTGPFVYTDSDVVPDQTCPRDIISHLAAILQLNSSIAKAGLGLRLDDLSEKYKFRDEVLTWEAQFWRRPVAKDLFLAPIDTTFALYRPDSAFAMHPAIRTGWPYLARHLPWYSDSTNPAEDDVYYQTTIKSTNRGHWGREQLPLWLQTAIAASSISSGHNLLHLGCGLSRLPGWINLDVRADARPDITFDLESCLTEKLPFESNSIDGFFMCHVFERIRNTVPLMEELYRVAKPNAHFILRLSCGFSKHARNFSQFAQPAFPGADHDYTGDWSCKRIKLVVDSNMLSRKTGKPGVTQINYESDCIYEMIVELEAVKPARPRHSQPIEPPTPSITESAIDMETAF